MVKKMISLKISAFPFMQLYFILFELRKLFSLYAFTSFSEFYICIYLQTFLILCFGLISHPFRISPFYHSSSCSSLPTSTYVLSFFFFFFMQLLVPFIKVCHCCLCFPNIFSPQRLSALSILLMLHVSPANMGHSYQHSLITLICCFLT